METEQTELDRRVLAHARILATLIRYLAEDRPEILSRLRDAFGNGHTMGEFEQNFTSTEHFSDRFIRAIETEILMQHPA